MISLLEENEASPDVLPFSSWPLRIARVLYDNGITTWPRLTGLTWNQAYSLPRLRERDCLFLVDQLERRGLEFRPNPPVIPRHQHRPVSAGRDAVWCNSGLYFIQSGGLVKIGVSSDFDDRMRTIRLHNPHPTKFIAKFLCRPSQAYKKERELHRHFADLRHGREWFRFEQPIIDYLEHFKIGASEVLPW